MSSSARGSLPPTPRRTPSAPPASTPVSVEVDTGSASSWDRHPSRIFLVRVRRGDDYVIVAIGLTRESADSLARRLARLLA